jgi:hypothetical protein
MLTSPGISSKLRTSPPARAINDRRGICATRRGAALAAGGEAMKTTVALFIALSLALSAGAAHSKIVIANWKPCATGIQHDDPSWDEIPAWARAKSLQPYYLGEPRLLAIHGLCNKKFHRVVLCLPGWEDGDKTEPEFKVCQEYQTILPDGH